MSGSTIPATVSALVTLFTATLPSVQVTDGPDYDARVNFLAVAWDSEDTPAIVANREIADARRARDQEEYEITCLLSIHDSVKSVALVRADLFTQLEALMSALDADQTLGHVVTRAWITQYAYVPSRGESGATVSVRFTVTVLAWK